jgi:integrase/recombinase XerD
MLLHVMRLLDFNSIRGVEIAEIERGSQLWGRDTEFHKTNRAGPKSAESFHYIALNWFKFQKLLITLPTETGYAESTIQDFSDFMQFRGMSTESIRVYSARMRPFLKWSLARCENISELSVRDVDVHLEMKRVDGCLPRTIASSCVALRLFFRYAELRGLNDRKISRDIENPKFARYDPLPKGPPWKQVRALLASENSGRPADLRASAIVLLCSIYGLRGAEIVRLTLEDFDWINEIMLVRRAKRGRIQQFPIQFEVGEAILKYLQQCRPRCECRNLFVTLKPPHRPIRSATIWTIIANRMRRSGFTVKAATHSFRHACATELLRQGSSPREIADFLGHRDLESVSIYAKSNIHSLRKVAAFSLRGVK